jgi:hypothetical protein
VSDEKETLARLKKISADLEAVQEASEDTVREVSRVERAVTRTQEGLQTPRPKRTSRKKR